MCIYYKNSENLTYRKLVTVFPDDLGGQKTMPDTVVSDKAYDCFLNIERSFMEKLFFTYMLVYGDNLTNSYNVLDKLKLQKTFIKLKEIHEYLDKIYLNKTNLELMNLNGFRDNMIRLYAFVTFNVFAFLGGKDLVLRDEFDDFREWIISGKGSITVLENNSYILNQTDFFLTSQTTHWCIIAKKDDEIYGIVSLFGMQPLIFRMGTINDDKLLEFPIGLICDYENGWEYSINI